MAQMVAAAARISPRWDGPVSGPPGMKGKRIAMVCEDLRNGGILGVAQGVQKAAEVIQWDVKVFDAGGTGQGRDKVMADALDMNPDGLILVGADAGVMKPLLLPFARQGIPVIGWHVGPLAGALTGGPVSMNISTDPLEVARVTAAAAVVNSGGRAGVVIFTDSNFNIAMTKAEAMAEIIRKSPGSTLLEFLDIPISQCAERMPKVTRELLERHGENWTCALAINDIYFDYAVPELIKLSQSTKHIRFLSAGDGSPSAFMRIQAGICQIGTVAEPLSLHGWQAVDELNRLLARQQVSGYIAPVHLVTQDNVKHDGGPLLKYDPDNGYRDIYRRIWK
ncbi:MAG: sugar ABC transporter substrate-binding protein [Desulfobacula sp. GWF2_41_7]|nr:MAG: sugar ABC transporter substrate-binding protein [Desulfobacula sp. GWF2_41_7]